MTTSFWRSTGAVAAGFAAIVVLSLGTDQVLHVLRVYPPWGEPMAGGLFAVATAYRIVYTVLGGYITARLAPHAPVRHALDRKSTRLNSSHGYISYAVFCLKKK